MEGTEGLVQAREVVGDEVTQLLILDGEHAGHVAEREDGAWLCSCEWEARCDA